MSKKLSPPLGSYEGDPLMPDPRDKHIADLEQQLSALRGRLNPDFNQTVEIIDSEYVHEALSNFIHDSTDNNAIGIVHAIVKALEVVGG